MARCVGVSGGDVEVPVNREWMPVLVPSSTVSMVHNAHSHEHGHCDS